jgi:FAD:protein FMN transferase
VTVTAAGRARLERIDHVMGMPVIVHVCDAHISEQAVDRVFEWLRFVDRTFSTYKEDSEISRYNRGELALCDAHPAVRSVLRRCVQLREETGGYFDMATGGGIDPSGLVKGWSIAGGARLLERAGARRFAINAGGDIVVRGEAPQGGPWRLGIQHPLRRDAVAAVVALEDGALATSGEYERGAHIVDPHTGAPPEGLLSVSVIGPDLPTADAYATAAFAMGPGAAAWCASLKGYGAMVITADQHVLTTEAFQQARVS